MGEPLNIELLGYCGLYCGDCPGHTHRIADAATALIRAIDDARLDAVAKSLFADKLPHYATLRPTLAFLQQMRCPAVCRARPEPCDIGACCVAKGFVGCYECLEFEGCTKLVRLERDHGGACAANLREIRRVGLQAWLAAGRRKWFGDEPDEAERG